MEYLRICNVKLHCAQNEKFEHALSRRELEEYENMSEKRDSFRKIRLHVLCSGTPEKVSASVSSFSTPKSKAIAELNAVCKSSTRLSN